MATVALFSRNTLQHVLTSHVSRPTRAATRLAAFSTAATPPKKRMSYRIAASSRGKASTNPFSIPTNVHPFDARIHDAIGRQKGATLRERKLSRPDSGEDSFFVSKVGGGCRKGASPTPSDANAIAFGVADGVGGWADQGVDPADFAHALSTYMADGAMEWASTDGVHLHPRDLIEMGYARSLSDSSIYAGGSTANVAVALGDGRLELAKYVHTYY